MNLYTLFLILHLLGIAIGAGGAYSTDRTLLTALSDRKITKDEFRIIHHAGIFVFMGLGLLIVSGIGLFSLAPDFYLQSPRFLAKMTIVGILTLNGLFLHFLVLPLIKKHLHQHLLKTQTFQKHIPALLLVGSISFTSWTSALILGAWSSLDATFPQILTIYITIVTIGFLMGLIAYYTILRK